MKAYVKNTLILSICMLVSKMLGALYRIPLSNILGTEGIGLYQMVFPVYSLFLVAITGGMPTYVAQRISSFRAKGENERMRVLVKNCIFLSVLIAIVFCLILIIFAKPLSTLQGNSSAYLGYITVAISIIFSSITCVYKGYFQGMETMAYNASATIIEQLCKLGFGLLGAILLGKYGVIYAVAGAFLGVLLSELVTFVFMFILYQKNKQRTSKVYIKGTYLKNIFKQFVPLGLSSIILPLSSCIDSFLVINLLTYIGYEVFESTSLFGIATGMVSPFVNFPVLLFGTICTAFLPTLVSMLEKGEDTKDVVGGTYFFVWLFCVPCALGFIGIAPNIITLFFPAIESAYIRLAVVYLQISAFNIIYLSIANISYSILNSLGKFYLPLISQGVGFLIKTIMFVLLILFTNLGILSLAIAVTCGDALSCIIALLLTRKKIQIQLKIKNVLVPVFASILMFICVILANKYLLLNEYIKIIIMVFIALFVYFSICFVFRIISLKDIKDMFNKNKNVNKIKYE